VLALGGERDLQVPAKPDLEAIEKALKDGGNKDVTTKELPKLNHLFQTSETGAPAEYAKIEETFAPAALEEISGWIGRRFGGRGGATAAGRPGEGGGATGAAGPRPGPAGAITGAAGLTTAPTATSAAAGMGATTPASASASGSTPTATATATPPTTTRCRPTA